MSHAMGTPPLHRLSLTPQTLAKVIKSKVRSTERPPQASPLVSDPSQVLVSQQSRDFGIRRTAANWLPVYRAFRHHNRILTKIRRIDGNVASLGAHLQTFIPADRITIKPELSQIVLRGDYAQTLRDWMTLNKF